MLTIVPKWRVVVTRHDKGLCVVWVNAISVAEVMRKIADIQFEETGLHSPIEVNISLVPLSQTGVSHT